jgi:hypothetical protein
MIGFALSSAVPSAPITNQIATALLENLRRCEALWLQQNTDVQDANAREWGCVANVELRWSAETGAVDPSPDLAVVQLVQDLPPGTPPGDMAYHTVDPQGRPLCLISYSACGDNWPSAASHEICECREDAPCTIQCDAPDGTKWDREVCDPVQGSDYSENGVMVSNVVGPRYFNLQMTGPFDIAGAVTGAFQQLSGGYHDGSAGQVFGDKVPPEKREYLARVGVRGKLQKAGR